MKKFQKRKKVLLQNNFVKVLKLYIDCPSEIYTYLNTVKNLRFDEKPDYQFLKSNF